MSVTVYQWLFPLFRIGIVGDLVTILIVEMILSVKFNFLSQSVNLSNQS